jgi:hypothetical protein
LKKGDTDSIGGFAIDAGCTDHYAESKESRMKKLHLSRDLIAVMHKSIGFSKHNQIIT